MPIFSHEGGAVFDTAGVPRQPVRRGQQQGQGQQGQGGGYEYDHDSVYDIYTMGPGVGQWTASPNPSFSPGKRMNVNDNIGRFGSGYGPGFGSAGRDAQARRGDREDGLVKSPAVEMTELRPGR